MNVVMDETICCGVVCFHGSGWLWVIQDFQNSSDFNGQLSIVEDSCNFCFNSQCDHMSQSLAFNKNGTIEGWNIGSVEMIREVKVTQDVAFCIG